MKKLILIVVMLNIFFAQSASAQVVTTWHTDGYASGVYVAGDHDNYPVEYYNEDAKEFQGIIPDLLDIISEQTSTPFVYINGDNQDKNDLGKNLQVDIVSAMDKNTSYGKQYLELISYKENDSIVHKGIVFTDISDEATITAITDAANAISQQEKNGIYMSYASNGEKINYIPVFVLIVALLLFIGFAVYLMFYIKKIKKGYEYDKAIDAETGMGNLQFFKHHFRYTLDDFSRTLYHIAYIVLDSSYLRSYYGESSFDEVLKYTATILSEHTGDREISARISENGFAFAFQALNEEDGQKRLSEILDKLNGFENVREQSNKLVFHAAVYSLSGTDRNCEVLLFNLRKNCTRILGTENQIIYCDTHSMNLVQEQKKIAESILNAFEKNEFKMYLQFIMDNKTRQFVSAEALSRWDSMEKGLLLPGKYISDMENSGFITKHDFYMFELACRQLEKWSTTEFRHISISCNFTRITLSEENFIDKLKMIAEGHVFDKSKLAIEITEDAIEKDRDIATNNVRLCKELGFKIYLDDLGSGYTSLSNLCDYPIDVVKIDRDILLKADTQRGKELFTGIVALAHTLNIRVICEGVETKEQNELVSHSDCDYIQGWHYSKALPLEECESFILSKKA